MPYKPFRRIDRVAFEDRLLCRIIDIDGEKRSHAQSAAAKSAF
jgi:hypothetical protein